MKYATYFGILAAVLLIIASIIPWAYYPDIKQTFNGFYSNQNIYGQPGKAFVFLAVLSSVFFLIPKLWAKRLNQFLGVIVLAYAVKSFNLFAACYQGICPQKKTGLFLMLISAICILIASLFSGVKLSEGSKNQ